VLCTFLPFVPQQHGNFPFRGGEEAGHRSKEQQKMPFFVLFKLLN